MTETDVEYLTPEELAALLKVHSRTVLRWAASDASMPAVRLGPRVVRFERQALERWLARKLPRRAQREAQQPRAAAEVPVLPTART